MMLFTGREGWKLKQKCDLGVKEIYSSLSGHEVERPIGHPDRDPGGQFDSQDLG